jgi:hypothetical protein
MVSAGSSIALLQAEILKRTIGDMSIERRRPMKARFMKVVAGAEDNQFLGLHKGASPAKFLETILVISAHDSTMISVG